MNHAIEVLEKELYLLEKVKKEFTESEYEKAKERYEKKVYDLKQGIEILKNTRK